MDVRLSFDPRELQRRHIAAADCRRQDLVRVILRLFKVAETFPAPLAVLMPGYRVQFVTIAFPVVNLEPCAANSYDGRFFFHDNS